MSSYRNKRPLKLILWSSQCKFWSVKPSTSPFLWPNLGKTEKNQIRKICTAAPSQLKAIAEKQGQHVEWLPLIIILMNIGNNYHFQWILIQCTNSYLQPPFRGANTSSAPCSMLLPPWSTTASPNFEVVYFLRLPRKKAEEEGCLSWVGSVAPNPCKTIINSQRKLNSTWKKTRQIKKHHVILHIIVPFRSSSTR